MKTQIPIKHIESAIEQIENVQKSFPDMLRNEIRYQLKMMYLQGVIDQLENELKKKGIKI